MVKLTKGASRDLEQAAGAPVRVQLSRAKGWKMPDNTVKVDRTSKWGNPYKIGDIVQRFGSPHVCDAVHVRDAATAVALHREWIELHMRQHANIMLPALASLRGKNLGCWCKLCPAHRAGKPFGLHCEACAPCHADVTGELANADSAGPQDEGGGSSSATQSDAQSAPVTEAVWRVCHVLTADCKRCPPEEDMPPHGRCIRGCYHHAQECVNTVETGNPWRKTEGVRAPWVVLAVKP